MKKTLICLLIVAATLFSVVSCSCIRSETKYDYDMEDYITLPNLSNYTVEIELDAIQQAIDTYLMKYASEYTIKNGDRVNVEFKVYEAIFSSGPDGEFYKKGNVIEELCNDDLWIDTVGVSVNGKYQISSKIEQGIKGSKVGATLKNEYVEENMLGTDFFDERYHNTPLYTEIKIKNVVAENGDIALVSYTGYYVDENDNIVIEDGKEKTFDSSDSSSFYIGSQMAIEEFETGLIGMTIDEEKDIFATFPKDYQNNTELAGKKVMFRVTLKSLYTAPIYSDNFVESYLGFKTTQEFEAALKNEFVQAKVREYLVDKSEIIKYPKSEYKATTKEFEDNAEAFQEEYGLTVEEYVKQEYDMTLDEYIKSNMRTEMIYYALCQQLKDTQDVVPTEDELKAELEAQIADLESYYLSSGLTADAAAAKAESDIASFGDSYIYENVMYEKVDAVIPTIVKVKEIAKTYTSISEAQVQ